MKNNQHSSRDRVNKCYGIVQDHNLSVKVWLKDLIEAFILFYFIENI